MQKSFKKTVTLTFISLRLTSSHQFLMVVMNFFLPNWPSYKKRVWSFNNNILVDIPSHSYVLFNQSILCNCDAEPESKFLLESLAACNPSTTNWVMYFTANLAFVNYLDNLIDSLDTPIIQNWTTQEQILPISLQSFEFNSSLLQVPKMLKDFCINISVKRKFLNCKKGMLMVIV